MKENKYRICIQRCGYAVVNGRNEQEALEKAAELQENDFDWESVDHDMIEDAAEIVEELKKEEGE